MTIGIGGWGSRRKPMAFVRALLRTDVTDLTVVTYGGPDVGLLCSAGKVKRVYYGFVSLDSPPFYDPWFAKARTTGAIESREMDEGMLRCGLQAAAQRLPFLPIRAGLGSDVRAFWGDELKTVTSPYPSRRRLRGTRRDARAEPRRRVRPPESRRRARQRRLHRYRPVLRRPVPDGRAEALPVRRDSGADRGVGRRRFRRRRC